MAAKQHTQKAIQVCAHWQAMDEPVLIGTLYATPYRGKEVFSFEYEKSWLQSDYAQNLDPDLGITVYTSNSFSSSVLVNGKAYNSDSRAAWRRGEL